MKFCILNITGAAILFAGWMQGTVATFFAETPLVWSVAIAGLALTGLALVRAGRWRMVRYVMIALPLVGMLGTLWGLKIVFAGKGIDDTAVILNGLFLALNTTIAGSVGYLWLLAHKALLTDE